MRIRRVLSSVLALCLVAGMLPMNVFAQDVADSLPETSAVSGIEPQGLPLPEETPAEETAKSPQPEEAETPGNTPDAPAGQDQQNAELAKAETTENSEVSVLSSLDCTFEIIQPSDYFGQPKDPIFYQDRGWIGMQDQAKVYLRIKNKEPNWQGCGNLESLTLCKEGSPIRDFADASKGAFTGEQEYTLYNDLSLNNMDLASGEYTLKAETTDGSTFESNPLNIRSGRSGPWMNYNPGTHTMPHMQDYRILTDFEFISGNVIEPEETNDPMYKQSDDYVRVFDYGSAISMNVLDWMPPANDQNVLMYAIPADITPDDMQAYEAAKVDIPYSQINDLDPSHTSATLPFIHLRDFESSNTDLNPLNSGYYRFLFEGISPLDDRPFRALSQPFGLRRITSLAVDGDFKNTYSVGEKLDLSGIQLTASYGAGFASQVLGEEFPFAEVESDYVTNGFAKTGAYTIKLGLAGNTNQDYYPNILAEYTVEVTNPPVNMAEVFPDAGFRAAVYKALDRETTQDVYAEDLAALTAVDASGKNVETVEGLEKLTALKTLNLSGSKLASLALPDTSVIETLNLSNSAELRDLEGNTAFEKIKHLDISYTKLYGFYDYYSMPLVSLNCSGLPNEGLGLSENTQLENLICKDSELYMLSLPDSIKTVDCSGNNIEQFYMDNPTKLTSLNCSNNLLIDLDLTNCTSLTSLNCSNNYLNKAGAIKGLAALESQLITSTTTPQRVNEVSAPGTPELYTRTSKSVTFSWADSTDLFGIEYYEIHRGDRSEPIIVDGQNAAYKDTGLVPGTEYVYSILGVSKSGDKSPMGPAATFATPLVTVQAKRVLEGTYIKEVDPSLSLSAKPMPEKDQSYGGSIKVYYEYKKAGAENWSKTLDFKHFIDFYNDHYVGILEIASLEPGSYLGRYAAVDADGTTGYTAEQSFEVKSDDIAPKISGVKPDNNQHFGKNAPIKFSAYIVENVGISQVELAYSTDGGTSFTTFKTISPEGQPKNWDFEETFNQAGLATGKVILRAKATDKNGNVGYGSVSINLHMDAPAKPEAFAVEGTSQNIALSWEYGEVTSEFSSFVIYRSTSPDSGFALHRTTTSVGFFDDVRSGVAADTTYYYYIAAKDKYGNLSDVTATLSAKMTPDGESPKIAAYLPADNAKLCHTADVVVSATDNYKLDKLVVEYRKQGESTWLIAGEKAAGTNSNNEIFRYKWDIKTLEQGKYDIRLSVYDAAGNPPDVKTIAADIKTYTLPAAPLASAQTGHKTISLSWTYPGDAENLYCYKIYRSTTSGTGFVHLRSFAPETLSFEDNVENGTQYFYKVVARDNFGAEQESAEIAATAVSNDDTDPTAVITTAGTVAAKGVEFSFSGVESTDNDGIKSWNWDFGDGKTASGEKTAHSFEAAGEYTVKLTVTDDSGNTNTATITITVVDTSSGETGYTLLTIRTVDASKAGTPAIKAAAIQIKAVKGSFETSTVSGDDGTAVVLLEKGSYTISATQNGFMPRTVTTEIKQGDAAAEALVGLSPVSLVTGEISVKEMTKEEIIEAGIDTQDPNNLHVSKIEVVFEFTVADKPFKLPVAYYRNDAGHIVGDNKGGFFGGNPGGGVFTEGGYNLGVFPISDKMYLVIYGEAHWLKEMYNVELVVTNNSHTDSIENCTAELQLPEGLSLAALIDRVQSAKIDLGTIGTASSASSKAVASWFVRGDKEGEYDISAVVSGTNMPGGDPFTQTFTTSEKTKVYAGTALKLNIHAPKTAYRGMPYTVDFELKNVSPKSLYNLSFSLKGSGRFTAKPEKGLGTGSWTQEDFAKGGSISVGELTPGGSVIISFTANDWMDSGLLPGLIPVEYLLTNVFVTTLEGSTTEIPYEVFYEAAEKTAVFEKQKTPSGGTVYLIEKSRTENNKLNRGKTKTYTIKGTSEDKAPHAVLKIANGSFGSEKKGKVNVTATGGNYELNPNGSITLTGDTELTVTALEEGTASINLAYNTDDVYEVNFTVEKEAILEITSPATSRAAIPETGKTTIPLAAKHTSATGETETVTTGAVWSIAPAAGIAVNGANLEISPDAEPGSYMLKAEYSGLQATFEITLYALPVVSKLEAQPASLGWKGGETLVTITGTALFAEMQAGLFQQGKLVQTAAVENLNAEKTSAQARFTLPAAPQAAQGYTVKVSFDGENFEAQPAADIQVAARPAMANPVITAHPQDVQVKQGDAVKLEVKATSPDGGSLSYQWYSSANSIGEGAAVAGATSAVYQPPTNAIGTMWYYVVVANTGADPEALSALTQTGKVSVQVQSKEAPLVPVASVALSPAASKLKIGAKLQIKATVSPANATNKTVSYTSSNPRAASVDANGLVTAVAEGSAVITASAGGKTAASTITVYSNVTRLYSPLSTVYLKKGASLKLPVLAETTDTKAPKLSWKSSKPAIAKVDQNGKVNALKPGTAKITATAANGRKLTITVKVAASVKAPVKITIKGAPKTMKVKKQAYLKIAASPSNSAAGTVKWRSSSTAIKVDSAGRITAVKKGTAVITAKAGGKTASVKITVK